MSLTSREICRTFRDLVLRTLISSREAMRSSRSSSSRGVCGQALLVVYCKCTWGDFGGRWVGIPPWCPIWVGRPVLGSSLEATKVCGGGKMSEPSKHRARKARGEEKQEEREEADWRGYTTAGDPQPQLNLHLPEIHRSRTRKGLRSALTPQNCMWVVWGGGVQDLLRVSVMLLF